MKKHLRKVPKGILEKIKKIESEDIVVACAVKYKAATIRKGLLRPLGIRLGTKGLIVPSSVVPPSSQGKYSSRNADGYEIVRKDLPKKTKFVSVETPNWGSWFHGSHTVDLPHEYYQRDFIPPQEAEIFAHSPEVAPGLPAYVISFRVNLVLRKGSRGFRHKLLDVLNLLQENVGACGVEAAQTPLEKYAKSLHVTWEILPPGTRQEAIRRLFAGRVPSKRQKDVAAERYDFFMSLKPAKLVYGSSGFRRYFGALIQDDLVVFENIEYGNAVYVMFTRWQELSRLSRIDLLSGKYGRDFVRVPHVNTWKRLVTKIVKAKRSKHGRK